MTKEMIIFAGCAGTPQYKIEYILYETPPAHIGSRHPCIRGCGCREVECAKQANEAGRMAGIFRRKRGYSLLRQHQAGPRVPEDAQTEG